MGPDVKEKALQRNGKIAVQAKDIKSTAQFHLVKSDKIQNEKSVTWLVKD